MFDDEELLKLLQNRTNSYGENKFRTKNGKKRLSSYDSFTISLATFLKAN